MKKFSGLFVGTGAALTIAMGFVPQRLKIQNVTGADLAYIQWNDKMTAAVTACEGIKYRDSTGVQMTALTVGLGVKRYHGGDVIAASVAAKIAPANLIDDPVNGFAGDMRSRGTAGRIDTITIDTVANRTGHFNAAVNTTLVGVGSKVRIGYRGQESNLRRFYSIVAITNAGSAADEVTFDELPVGNEVDLITYKYDLAQAPAGFRMPAGITLAETADVNVSGELCYIEAEADD